jgi:hypothetical protein
MFAVTFYFETSENAASDLELVTRVNADDWRHALVVAKKVLKAKYPSFNFSRIWCWFVEGKPHRI